MEGARHQVRCFGRSARKVDCSDGFGWDVGRLVVSERRACRVLAPPRSRQRHAARVPTDEAALIARIIALARRFGRDGFRRITARLRVEGWRGNHKRVGRLWHQGGGACHARPRAGGGAGRPPDPVRGAGWSGRTPSGPTISSTRGRVHAGVPQQRQSAVDLSGLALAIRL